MIETMALSGLPQKMFVEALSFSINQQFDRMA
jgi:hypothetical protein